MRNELYSEWSFLWKNLKFGIWNFKGQRKFEWLVDDRDHGAWNIEKVLIFILLMSILIFALTSIV